MSPTTRNPAERGFTLLELMIVAAILAIVASIGVPQYRSALLAARVQKAKQELVTIAQAIDSYRGRCGGLPLTLANVGYGGRRDPWGTPYCYLNYADGTGDGLEWAVSAGLVAPSALRTVGGAPAPSAPAPRGGLGGGSGFQLAPEAQRVDITSLTTREVSIAERESLVTSFADQGETELFTGVTSEVVRRRDRYMFPLNTDYDLFSLGANRATAVSVGQAVSLDDVIRANDGGFFGKASDY
jgi:general secretion pathway protein G